MISRVSNFKYALRSRRYRRKRQTKLFRNNDKGYRSKSNPSNSENSECEKFVDDAEKITDLLEKFNNKGIDNIETFSSLSTSIVNATDEKGNFYNGDCNKAQERSLVKVNGIFVLIKKS